MSDEFSVAEKIVEEVLIDLMTERVMSMSIGIQASSNERSASLSIDCSWIGAILTDCREENQTQRRPSQCEVDSIYIT
jgi:hypothetical protein